MLAARGWHSPAHAGSRYRFVNLGANIGLFAYLDSPGNRIYMGVEDSVSAAVDSRIPWRSVTAARHAVRRLGRVLSPGGYAFIVTECFLRAHPLNSRLSSVRARAGSASRSLPLAGDQGERAAVGGSRRPRAHYQRALPPHRSPESGQLSLQNARGSVDLRYAHEAEALGVSSRMLSRCCVSRWRVAVR